METKNFFLYGGVGGGADKLVYTPAPPNDGVIVTSSKPLPIITSGIKTYSMVSSPITIQPRQA